MGGQTVFRTLGGRLGWAIERQPPEGRSRGTGLFISRMKEAGVTVGASYPSIATYVRDEVEPPLPFVRTAAEVLGLRVAWLAFGQGAPTEEEERQRKGHREVRDRGDLWDWFHETVPALHHLDPEVITALLTASTRLASARATLGHADGPLRWEDLVGPAWSIVEKPFDLFLPPGKDPRSPIVFSPHGFSDYAIAMLHAISLGARMALEAAGPPSPPPEEPDAETT